MGSKDQEAMDYRQKIGEGSRLDGWEGENEKRRVTGAVTKWQCAAFITWLVSPATSPFMATFRPAHRFPSSDMRTYYNIVRTITPNRLVTKCANSPSFTNCNRQTRGERGHVSLEALSITLALLIKHDSPEIRFAVS